jgi:hypothetical protein
MLVMKKLLPILLLIIIVDELKGQETWSHAVGLEFMPQVYLPKVDDRTENKLQVGYTLGPCFRYHKNDFALVAGLRYSKVNSHYFFSDQGTSQIGGYHSIEVDQKKSFNHFEFSLLPGVEFGEGKNKVCVSPGIIASYLYKVKYSGTSISNINNHIETREYSGYNQDEDWIWRGALSVSYVRTLTERFSFDIGTQVQYAFSYHYYLLGINLRIFYNLNQNK